MDRPFRVPTLVLAATLAACSGGDFTNTDNGETGSPAPDVDGTDAADTADSTTPPVDSGTVDTAADTGVDAAPEVVAIDSMPPTEVATDTPPSCSVLTFTAASSEADAMVLQSAPTFNWGGPGMMGARNDLGGPALALMRFDVGGLPTTAKIQSVTLDLSWASNSFDCGTSGTCVSCAPVDKAGTFDLFLMRSDWVESKVSWNTRDGTAAWGTAGALLSGVDRSTTPVATFKRELAASASVALDPGAFTRFTEWRTTSNKVSFLVQAQATALFLIATREGRTTCPTTGAPPKLTVRYCT